jgi:hypothetical protein
MSTPSGMSEIAIREQLNGMRNDISVTRLVVIISLIDTLFKKGEGKSTVYFSGHFCVRKLWKLAIS